jgi:hypothetical protein
VRFRAGAAPDAEAAATDAAAVQMTSERHQMLAGLDSRNFAAPIRQILAGIAAHAIGAPIARVLTQPGAKAAARDRPTMSKT